MRFPLGLVPDEEANDRLYISLDHPSDLGDAMHGATTVLCFPCAEGTERIGSIEYRTRRREIRRWTLQPMCFMIFARIQHLSQKWREHPAMKKHIWLLMVILAMPLVTSCRTAILHSLSEQDSNQVIAILQDQGIIATKELDNAEANTWRVTVPKRDAVKVWSVLQEYKLPAMPSRRFQDVFGKSKLVVAPIEEKALFLEALQGELSHTLESVTNVVAARVHIVLPEEDIAGQMRGEAKASVMLEYRPDPAGQPPLHLEEVQKLVANGVNGLKLESVAVVMKQIQMTRMVQSNTFTSFGPLTVAEASVTTFKITAILVFLIFFVLAFMLFWQGRLLGQLRFELADVEHQLHSAQRQAK